MILLGALFGSISTGYFADRYGRRSVLFFSAILFVISNVPVLFISSLPALLLLRFVTGIAAGITSLSCPLYLAEIAPPTKRGAFVGSFQLAVTLGTLIAYALNLQFAESGSWRVMLFFTAVPAAFQAVALFFIPETPKWLFGSGQIEKGAAVLGSLHTEVDFPVHEEKPGALKWNSLFKPYFRKGLWIGICLVVLQQWCGINAIVYFAPSIFQNAGFADAKSAIGVTFGLGVANFISTLLALFLIDRLGRRILLLISQGGVALSLIFFTATCIFPGYSFLSVLSLIFYILTYAIGLGPIPWVVISEIYPLVIRAHGIAVMTFLSWLSNFLVVYTFPRFIASWGAAWTFAIYTAISLIAFWIFYRIIPETKGKSLEEVELSLYR